MNITILLLLSFWQHWELQEMSSKDLIIIELEMQINKIVRILILKLHIEPRLVVFYINKFTLAKTLKSDG